MNQDPKVYPMKPKGRNILSENSTPKDGNKRRISNLYSRDKHTEQKKKNSISMIEGNSHTFLQISTNNSINSFLSENDLDLEKIYEKIKSTKPEIRHIFERKILEELMAKRTEVQYILDIVWYDNYIKFLNTRRMNAIPPIDNTSLNCRLSEAKENTDYIFINEYFWTIILKLYGGGPEIKREEDKKKPKKWRLSELDAPKGISNEMYYCYMNTVLQCLFSIEIFVLKLKEARGKSLIPLLKNLVFDLQMPSQEKKYESAEELKKYIKKFFSSINQHDSHEFLLFLLAKIQGELIDKKDNFADLSQSKSPKEAWIKFKTTFGSFVDKMFTGLILIEKICSKCKKVSQSFEPFIDLSLSITDNDPVSLYDCLFLFFQEQQIQDYLCDFCKEKGLATLNSKLVRLPKILIVQLKRFKHSQESKSKSKISNLVTCPIEQLNLASFCSQIAEIEEKRQNYSLSGAIEHLGRDDSGHYLAFSKRNQNVCKLISVVLF